jgi:hypothetical protein
MATAKGIITLAIGIAILLYTVSAIVPDAMTNFNDANTTGWDASVVALWNIIPVFAMLSIAIGAIVIGIGELTGL